MIIAAALALLVQAAQDPLKRPPEILKDPARHGIGKSHDVPAMAEHRKGAKLLVAAFAAADCPLSKIYRPRLERLATAYRAKGVRFVAVRCQFATSPGKDASDLPLVHDADGKIAAVLGARRTTDAFVLDAGGVLRYRGAIDDQYGIGYTKDAPGRTYLRDALDALLAGRTPAVAATEAPG